MGNTQGVYYKDTIKTSFLHVGEYPNCNLGIIANLKLAPKTAIIIYQHPNFTGESYSFTNPLNQFITIVNPVIRHPGSLRIKAL